VNELVDDLIHCRELLQEIGVVSFDRSYLQTSVKTLVFKQQSRNAGHQGQEAMKADTAELKSVHEDEFNTIW